jgi:hypothetical protein
MNFITPWLAAIAAAIAIPSLIILYFLKLRRRDLEVSTTLLWKKAIQDLQANAPFQRLRRNILLFLQLLVLAAVLFALAQPMIKGQTLSGERFVILIDRSASMSSEDVEGPGGADAPKVSRLDEAKRQAIALVDSLKEGDALFGQSRGDQAKVIVFDNTAESLQTFTNDKRKLKAAIEGIQPTDKVSSITDEQRSGIVEAVRLALADLPRRKVSDQVTDPEGNVLGNETISVDGLYESTVAMHIYSDGKLLGSSQARPGIENTVEYHAIGDPAAKNTGIITLKAERDYEQPTKVTIFVGLQNTDEQPRSVDVELLIDGVTAQIQPAQLPGANVAQGADPSEAASAGAISNQQSEQVVATQIRRPGTSGVTFRLDRSQGMLAQVRLRQPGTGERPTDDVLRVDDRAWLVVPPAQRMSVAIVGRENLFLRLALEGLPLARFDRFSLSEFEQLWQQGRAGVYDVVILDGAIPNVGQQIISTVTTGAAGAPTTTTPAPPATTPAGTGTVNAAGVHRPLPPGKYLVFGTVPAGLGLTDKGLMSQPATVIDWSREHPATRNLVLDSLQIAQFREVIVDPASGVTKIAYAERGPAILEVAKADTRALIVPFDYMESTWPLDLSFVVFVASSVKYLGEEVGGQYDARALAPGGELQDTLPMGVTEARIDGPGELRASVRPSADGSIVYRIPPTTGVYEVTWEGTAAPGDIREGGDTGRVLRIFAANLLDQQESDVPTAQQLELATKVEQAAASATGKGDRRLWPYLILLGLAVVLLEWFIYNRKVYV